MAANPNPNKRGGKSTKSKVWVECAVVWASFLNPNPKVKELVECKIFTKSKSLTLAGGRKICKPRVCGLAEMIVQPGWAKG